MPLKDLFQSADWKAEKHSPVIEIETVPEKGKPIIVSISIGKEIPHPNTSEHHISWIDLYFHPDGEKFPYHLGKYEFASHGASINGPNTSTIFSEPFVSVKFKTEKSGTILASSFCNIHGLWASEIKLEL
ncbi:MAG: class II SORL domain-containing protein [Ignavibacteriales bacterium]|nr:class II SORL domain-containing protein [Ignavibacteriales bacterium]